MVGTSVQRRLAAILAADVAGFSRMVGHDEAGTLAQLRDIRIALLDPMIARHGGRLFKTMGDGMLVEFSSVVAAVACAAEIQAELAGRNADLPDDKTIRLRIGVNLGDVIIEGDDLLGDGVNVAARLEGIAPVGGVVVSGNVRDNIGNRLDVLFDDMGEQVLKNIVSPVRAFRLVPAAPAAGQARMTTETAERPSIAVLPFVNIGGDPEQEYFSDGISEDVINDLGKIGAIRVISRNTSFTFKGKSTNLGQAARQLNVRYVLEGSVRRAGDRVRVSAQLIDGTTDTHVWAERYDRTLDDIFAIQDDISASIVAALKVRLLPAEKTAIEQRGTGNAEAYRLVLLARYYRYSNTIHDTRLALRFAQEAVAADPGYAEAWALIAASQIALHEMAGSPETGMSAAARALEIDPDLAIALASMGRVLCGLGRYDEAFAVHKRSVSASPDSYEVNFLFGRTCTELGAAEMAVKYHERAAAISETEFLPLALAIQSYNAMGQREKGRDASIRALSRIEAALARRSDDASALFHGASVLADLGQRDRAVEWAERAISVAPDEARGRYLLACTFSLLGEQERALGHLEKALARMHPRFLTWVENDSDLDNLRGHQRYRTLLDGMRRRSAEDPTG